MHRTPDPPLEARAVPPSVGDVGARAGTAPDLPDVVEAVRRSRSNAPGAMSVAFFEFQHKPSLIETAFELVHRHLRHGDAVDYRFLGYDLAPTYLSPIAGSTLFGAWLPERRAARLVADPSLTFVPRVRLPLRPLPFPVPDTLDELMQLRYEGFDVGMAVASSMISKTRNSRLRPADHASTVKRILQGALAVHAYVLETLRRDPPDLVYVYNGRLAYERAVLRACQQLGVPYLVYEMGSTPDSFFLQPFTTHDRVKVQASMRATWQAVRDRPEAAEAAAAWFVERREGRPRDWPAFTTAQTRSRLPEGLEGKRIVAYFSSSDDEFVAVGDEYRWQGWANQYEAVRGLIQAVDALPDAHLVVRIHPHLSRKHPSERERWMRLAGSSPSLTVIAPESDVDSYALIDSSDVVVTGGSTVGAEAVFWDRPSILLGPSEYDELHLAHRANDVATLERLLRAPALSVPRDAALAFGYYRATYGEPFAVYRPSGLHHGTFLGADLRVPAWRVLADARNRALSRLRRLRARWA